MAEQCNIVIVFPNTLWCDSTAAKRTVFKILFLHTARKTATREILEREELFEFKIVDEQEIHPLLDMMKEKHGKAFYNEKRVQFNE